MLAQKEGIKIAKPTNTIIPPDSIFQKYCGILIKRVLALSKSVNKITDIDSDTITITALLDI